MSVPGIPPGLLGHPSLSAHAMIASLGPSDSVHHQNTGDPSIRQIGPKEGVTRDDRWSGPRTAMEQVVYHDNSDVSMEQQVNLMSKNKHMHNLAITTLRSQFELLKVAISERA